MHAPALALRFARAIEGDDGVDEARLAAARGLILRAPVCIMVVSTAAPHPKIPEWEQLLSSGAASFALLLAAHALGYAGCWLTEWPAYDARARAALGLSESERIAGFIYLGALARARTRTHPRRCGVAHFAVLKQKRPPRRRDGQS